MSEDDQAEPEETESLLTDDEAHLLSQLRDQVWGASIRLEQEHLSIADVYAAFN